MEENLVIFETAKLAKEKEFCEVSNYPFWFHNTGVEAGLFEDLWNVKKSEYFQHECILRPTQSFLQKWLREVHNIEIAVQWFDNCYIKAVAKKPFKANTYRVEGFQTYEKALEVGLQEALKLIKIIKNK